MRVLVIGYFREASGWGQATRDFVLAMDAVGIDVVIRCVYLSNSSYKLPDRLIELENKSSTNCDICCQYLLPHHMEFCGKFRKTIGLFTTETSNFRESTWSDSLNLMDELIVPCRANVSSCVMSGVDVPIHIVPYSTDISRFERGYDTLDLLRPYREQESFIFYSIGEWVRRKNFGALLRAFHTEFDPDENVELVIKSNVPGLSPAQSKALIESACTEIKDGLKLHGNAARFKKEIVITDRLSEEGLMKLHTSCDCYILPSRGEAWAIPAFDAMAMGKTPILPATSPFDEYSQDECGFFVSTYPAQVFGVKESRDCPFADLFTGRELWNEVDHRSLCRSMRTAFECKDKRESMSEAGRERAYDFRYQRVGHQIQKVLNGQKAG